MKAGTFYIFAEDTENDNKPCVVPVTGFIEGNIGVHCVGDKLWQSTHIPTGNRINANYTLNRKAAFVEARERISHPTNAAWIENYMKSAEHELFVQLCEKAVRKTCEQTQSIQSEENMRTDAKYPIGTTFQRRGKKYVSTITDIYRTYNNIGELVKVEYKAEHEFAGHTVSELVPETTVSFGLLEVKERCKNIP